MRITAEGRRQVVASLGEARALIARRRADAMRRLSEAEAEVNQLGRMLTAADAVIEAWSETQTLAEGQNDE